MLIYDFVGINLYISFYKFVWMLKIFSDQIITPLLTSSQ